jgi:hypothetical protein
MPLHRHSGQVSHNSYKGQIRDAMNAASQRAAMGNEAPVGAHGQGERQSGAEQADDWSAAAREVVGWARTRQIMG